jgi:hypothetical protein
MRRFPPPWSVRELQQAFRIDANGQAIARNSPKADIRPMTQW